MTVARIFSGLAILLLAEVAAAQVQNGPRAQDRAKAQRHYKLNEAAPRFVSPSMQIHSKTGTFESSRYRGITTRPEQIRSMMPGRMTRGTNQRDLARTSPIKTLLDQRNLLAMRSPLARRTGSYIGHNDYAINASGHMNGDYAQIEKQVQATTAPVDPLKPNDGRYEDAIVARLKAKADEYYDTAMIAFRKGQYIQARDYFDLMRDLEPDATRAYVGSVFVSLQKDDFLQASSSLLRALDIMKTLDDVKVDATRFYKSPEDFNRRVERVNYIAQLNKDKEVPSLLLAYFSWVRGDIGTAIDAAANAEKLLKSPGNVPIKKFRELLIQQRTAVPAATK